MVNIDEKRFWKPVHLSQHIARGMLTLCWVYRKEGETYGTITVDGEKTAAHDFAWMLKGCEKPPKGFGLHHMCQNKRCVNTDHLVMATDSGHRRQLHKVTLKAIFPCECEFDEDNPLINAAGYRLCPIHSPIPKSCDTQEQKDYLAKVAKLANVYGQMSLNRLLSSPTATVPSVGHWIRSRRPIPPEYFKRIKELHNQLD